MSAIVNKLHRVFSVAQIDAMARETEFALRRSKIPASDFIRMLLLDHFSHPLPSLSYHALNLHDDSGKTVSKQAIDKRFNGNCVQFIRRIFELFLNQQLVNGALPGYLNDHFKSVKVMDSTEFKLPDSFAPDFPGYSTSNAPACAAIQFEYDALSRKIHYLSLTSARQSDKTIADQRMNTIQPGDLILRDLGYYSTDSYRKIEQQQGFYISRLKPQVSIFQKTDKPDKPLKWLAIIKMIENSGTGYFDQWVYIGKEQKHPVRLMAWLLPQTEQQKRLRRKKSNRGRIRKEDLVWSRLNFLLPISGSRC